MRQRRTKIVCTLGPATDSAESIAGLIDAGMDLARLNFSHGDHAHHRTVIRRIREASDRSGTPVGILQDLGGPKIRLGELPDAGVWIETGGSVDLAPAQRAPSGTLPVEYEFLLDDVTAGETILLADGAAELEVTEARSDRLVCRVLNGGMLTSRKGVNLPHADLRVPAVTDKDLADLELGLEEGVDIVALSFVRHEDDLRPVLDRISNLDRPPLITAKIEKPQAVERIEPILAVVDAVMVARGDLGVEMPPEKVPVIQKRIISAARWSGRPVITATQMLRSMVDSPRPLRAEASDIANAVFDGTDALMLSEETAIGRYPELAVQMLDRVAREVEPELGHDRLAAASQTDGTPDLTDAVSLAACELATAIGAAAIVTTTSSGGTARMIARHRPSMPVLGVTTSMTVARQLNLSWGVVPVAVASTDDPVELRRMLLRELTDHQLAAPGDHVVVVAGLPLGFSDAANVIQVHRLD